MIIQHDLYFSFVEYKRFRELIKYLCLNAKVPSRRAWTIYINNTRSPQIRCQGYPTRDFGQHTFQYDFLLFIHIINIYSASTPRRYLSIQTQVFYQFSKPPIFNKRERKVMLYDHHAYKIIHYFLINFSSS